MPGFDGTGPGGYGPGTGWGMGPCGRGMAFRRGFGCGGGRGRGRGFGMGFGPAYYGNYYDPGPLSKEAQKQLLEAELRRIEEERAEIERQLNAIE
jgi:hypothetical protein